MIYLGALLNHDDFRQNYPMEVDFVLMAHRKEAHGRTNRTPAQREYERKYKRLKTRKQRGKIDVDEWNTAVARTQDLLAQSEWGKLTDEELREKLYQL